MTIISRLKTLSIKERYKISKSPKAFVILDKENNYILTDDLNRYKSIYINDGGCFGCIETIKKEL
jgi:hypothetical protein